MYMEADFAKGDRKLSEDEEQGAIYLCLIIAATFNNLDVPLDETDWPLLARSSLAQFLVRWAQLDAQPRLKAFAINALIPLLKGGPIFPPSFDFEKSMIEVFVACEAAVFAVLEDVLANHFTQFLAEYVAQGATRKKEEAVMFVKAVAGAVARTPDIERVHDHLGAMVVLALRAQYQCFADAKEILVHLGKAMGVEEDISQWEDFSKVPEVFEATTEQVLWAGVEVLSSIEAEPQGKLGPYTAVVHLLLPFLRKVRFIPGQPFIVPGIPSRYRKWTIILFVDALVALATKANEEFFEQLGEAWAALLPPVHSWVLLTCVFLSESDARSRIFWRLIEADPGAVSHFLVKRLTFAYHYHANHTKGAETHLEWVTKLLAKAYLVFPGQQFRAADAPIALTYSLLNIEKSRELFEAMAAVLDLDPADEWSPDPNDPSRPRATALVA
jgi:hypothetical protein